MGQHFLPLAIETGRFTRKDLSEKKCILCDSGVIENEQHFICNCTLYDDFRINLLNDAEKCMPGFLLRTEEDKFTYIMSSDDLTRSLYRFVRTLWNIRQNTLFKCRYHIFHLVASGSGGASCHREVGTDTFWSRGDGTVNRPRLPIYMVVIINNTVLLWYPYH